ncbi:MAG: DUF4395 domain-containing protein [Thermoleophilaceae bacterium]|nr:DUF4395 domain-containing protein [Thermoleophilaceae bacterium]
MVLNLQKRYTPSVDPFKDTDVIDQRAPRTLQTTVAIVTALAFLLNQPWLVALMALQLILGLTFGRIYCVPCVFWFKVLQPRFGEGRIEDSRPPRFANIVGAIFMTAATVLFILGLTTAGWVLTLIVTTLASLAAISGICVGCEMYAAWARMRGIALAH